MIGRAPIMMQPQFIAQPMQSFPGPQPQQWPPPRVQPAQQAQVAQRLRHRCLEPGLPAPEHTAYMTAKELEQFAGKVGWSNPPIDAAMQREKGKQKRAQSAA